ncbi:tyrosine-type recombinase/integrase [Candidatus Mycobacterium methanotrophicum]|uniref:Site-specific integrase n=1 Tax=Candidatus Mycobacterium methanotrophicum TaxID=2943498 RepID=A0ABY4QMQ9_9MYCO|nr:tyrosine-type recombinase/integrase [Candidatus Mycobacterium methanotrophicum]UQX10337.1 site-specific integrase [Candidatus Mycobacterium methanotrophicum]UQX12268.1 site-specific integrase [Candidatus Mycobacterium methanotrophicum]UQX12278.1 site-specific integrase [Candidatus Mycobacterium methanotrophicum]
MTAVATTLEMFFIERLTRQRQVSPQTVASYRDSLQLLLRFVNEQTGKEPCTLDWADLDEPVISSFLDHLQTRRGNSARTRNLRLTAIRALFRYAAFRHPEHAAVIQRVLAIPAKRADKRTVTFLAGDEAAALIDAPDRARWEGRRDHAWLALDIQTGLRVSELIGLNCGDITLGPGAHLRCEGKGRKQRAVPLTATIQAVLANWIAELAGRPGDPLFPTRSGRRLSRDAIEQRIAVHAHKAAQSCPSLKARHLHPHVLRHTCAVALLQAGVDTSVIALWLGHADVRSTNPYLHADLTIKEKALAITAQPTVAPGRYRPSDTVLAFLEGL